MAITRRNFVILCGAALPALYLPDQKPIELSRRFVLGFSGSCSFCGKRHGQVRALAGVVGRPQRICDVCVGLCLEIIGEESARDRSESGVLGAAGVEDLIHRVALGLSRRVPDPPDPRALSDALRELRQEVAAGVEPWSQRNTRPCSFDQFACSFCDVGRRDAWKLISGPRVFVCDVCAADASGLLMRTHQQVG